MQFHNFCAHPIAGTGLLNCCLANDKPYLTSCVTIPHTWITCPPAKIIINTQNKGNISGVVSERDYVCKIALLSKTSKDTPIKEISTKSANLIVASPSETVSDCMAKMLLKDIRHLPLLDEDGGVVGIVSIKDLVKAELKEKQDAIKTLSDFALGKGGHFSAE